MTAAKVSDTEHDDDPGSGQTTVNDPPEEAGISRRAIVRGEILTSWPEDLFIPPDALEVILEALANMEHVYRIRLGTRTPVVLPMRWTDSLVDMLAKYHRPGRREVAVVTHFEHSYEIGPEAREAVGRIRRRGIPRHLQPLDGKRAPWPG